MSYFKVLTQGQTLVVNITNNAGTAVTTYTDSGLGTSHTLPLTIGSDTEFHFAASRNYSPHLLTVSQPDGTVVYGPATVEPHPSKPHIIGPEPTAAQIAADTGSTNSLVPTGAVGETFPRLGAGIGNVSALTSGTLLLVAVNLRAGDVVSNITFTSGTQAAVSPTAWWFALYNSSRALLGQTADQTSTAWGSSTAKTVALASPHTVTYTGLHYVGICMVAGTPVSLRGVGGTSGVLGYAPILVGNSTASLTTTAPATADAITAGANMPYAYLS